jgi:hypothetical protein
MQQQEILRRFPMLLSPVCFQCLTKPSSRNPFLFTSMQNPRGARSGAGLLPAPAVFSATCRLLVSLCLLFTHAGLCFQRLAASFAKTPGVWGGQLRDDQRGRGRNGGRAVSGRGRMRKRGPSGGGTLRSDWPQQGQRPSSQNARVASARSQWPRASHCGLMHCTVKPGKNCISFPLGDQRTSWHRSSGAGPSSP